MKSFCIISCDKLFARMLELEIKELGLKVKTITEKLNPPALKLAISGFSAVVFDGDYYGGDLSFSEKENIPFIVFSSKPISVYPSNVTAFFERPFSVALFSEAVSEIAEVSRTIEKTQKKKTEIGDLELVMFSKYAKIDGKLIKFSPREFALLSLLYKNRGRIVPRKEVIETVWGEDYDMKNNADNVYINYLRKKLDNAIGVKMIYTIRGKGYMMK